MKDTSLKRIYGYGAATAAVLGSTSAYATINYVDINPDAMGSGTNAVLLSFNLAGDVSTTGINVSNEQFYAFNTKTPGSSPSSKLYFGTTNGVAAFDPAPLTYGTTIGPGQTVDPTTQSPAELKGIGKGAGGLWETGQQAYLALRFNNNGVANYGWGQFLVTDASTITLLDFAYDDAGNPVAAGSVDPVPEPSQMALFALGAAGVAAYRRRKSIYATK